jgi:ATP-dependent DNA helicase RecG
MSGASKGGATRLEASSPLETPLSSLSGIGARRAADLTRVGLSTIEDLLLRFPIRYEDRSHPQPIAELQPGTSAAVIGDVARCALKPTRRRGFTIFEITLRDDSGTLTVVWFNQRFLKDQFHHGQRVALFGKVELTGHGLQMSNPVFEILSEQGEREEEDPLTPQPPAPVTASNLHHGRIVPVYERVGSLTTKMQRSLVRQALDRLPETLLDPIPRDVRERYGWPGRAAALAAAHFPDESVDVETLNAFRSPAQVRLIFEEFFLFQLGVAARRQTMDAERKPFVPAVDDRIRAAARAVLPFKLTDGQKTSLGEIVRDMARPQPMNRLLQGDVGAGKTMVGLLAALVAMENGLQVAFMAPTEVLADQHLSTIRRVFAGTRFVIEALTGSTRTKARRDTLEALARGDVHLIVGTHALLQDDVLFKALGLAIIDEQHRFGVVQRSLLRRKGLPDVLVMTATPIPRTLALTTYGDLDVSLMRDRPAGRKPIRTTVRPETRRAEVWEFVRGELAAGRQAYVIYPVIEDSEKIDVRAATAMAEQLAREEFYDYKVALLHGRLKSSEKESIMASFTANETQVLVSTTVVEVGVDVPNATVMIVEHAERFGLSQLHQLRGRVGRGEAESHCVLLYQPPLSDDARERLKALSETTDGFLLAEKDLQLRGPGDFCGTRQSGLPTLRIGDLLRDQELMEQARDEARRWLESAAPADATLQLVRASWATRFGLVGVG